MKLSTPHQRAEVEVRHLVANAQMIVGLRREVKRLRDAEEARRVPMRGVLDAHQMAAVIRAHQEKP